MGRAFVIGLVISVIWSLALAGLLGEEPLPWNIVGRAAGVRSVHVGGAMLRTPRIAIAATVVALLGLAFVPAVIGEGLDGELNVVDCRGIG